MQREKQNYFSGRVSLFHGRHGLPNLDATVTGAELLALG
jgi:hypothetical protein